MTKPVFTIVIPAWNAEKTIRRTIASIQQQTFTKWELLVVNDGSEDNTERIARQLASEDSRIRIISTENNGAYKARLAGVQAAQADLIIFIDADDVLGPDNLETMMSIVSDSDGCDIVVGNLRFDGETRRRGQCFVHKIYGKLTAAEYQAALLEGKTLIGPVAKVFKKELFTSAAKALQLKRFDNNEDLLMLLKLVQASDNGIYIDPGQRVVYTYYRRRGSMSSRKTAAKEWFNLFQEINATLLPTVNRDILYRYELKIMWELCILPGISLSESEVEVAALKAKASQLSPLSKTERLTVWLLGCRPGRFIMSAAFRTARKIARTLNV